DAVNTIGASVIATVNDAVPVQPFAEVACTVKVNEPVAVGVPARAPPAARVSPPGAPPLATANVNGASPPDAVTLPEYGTPITPVLVTVTVDDVLEPGVTVPKSRLVGDTDSPPVPVPLNGTITLPLLVLVSVSDALFAPLSAG